MWLDAISLGTFSAIFSLTINALPALSVVLMGFPL